MVLATEEGVSNTVSSNSDGVEAVTPSLDPFSSVLCAPEAAALATGPRRSRDRQDTQDPAARAGKKQRIMTLLREILADGT